MTDRGLSQRLKQRSRRAGLMIGLTMGLAIAVLAGSFAVIYAALDPFTSDFVTRGNPGSVVTPAQLAANPDTEATAAAPAESGQQQPAPTPTPSPPPAPTEAAFAPDYQLEASRAVNFRSEPSTEASVIKTIAPGEPLQYLGNEAPTTRPEDGERWMNFRDELGNEGWVREIDVEPYEA